MAKLIEFLKGFWLKSEKQKNAPTKKKDNFNLSLTKEEIEHTLVMVKRARAANRADRGDENAPDNKTLMTWIIINQKIGSHK